VLRDHAARVGQARPSFLAKGLKSDRDERCDMVHSLEADLGDIVAERHRHALDGCHIVEQQAWSWAKTVVERSMSLLCDLAQSEEKLLTAGEALLNSYFTTPVMGEPPVAPCLPDRIDGLREYLRELCCVVKEELQKARLILPDVDVPEAESSLRHAPEDHEQTSPPNDSWVAEEKIRNVFERLRRAVDKMDVDVAGEQWTEPRLTSCTEQMLVLRIHVAERLRGMATRAVSIQRKAAKEARRILQRVLGMVKLRIVAEYSSVAHFAKGLLASAKASGKDLLRGLSQEPPIHTIVDDGLIVASKEVPGSLGLGMLSLRQLTQFITSLNDTAQAQLQYPSASSPAVRFLPQESIQAVMDSLADEQNDKLPAVWTMKRTVDGLPSFLDSSRPVLTGAPTDEDAPLSTVPWRRLSVLLINGLIPSFATLENLGRMTMRLRAKAIRLEDRFLLSKSQLMEEYLWFDESPQLLDTFASQTVKGLLATTFEVQDPAIPSGAAGLDELLYALCLVPSPSSQTGFAAGFYRSCYVASLLHPSSSKSRSEAQDGDLRLSRVAVHHLLQLTLPSSYIGLVDQILNDAFVPTQGDDVSFEELSRVESLKSLVATGWYEAKSLAAYLGEMTASSSE